MLAILIVILVLIGAAVVGSIYSNFLVFYSNFSETENYHKAYYASISALERAELVTKQRQPGYVGSGGFIRGNGTGSFSNGGSDKSLSGFSYFGDNKEDTTVFRTINSRTNRIPATGDGDVEWMLATGDSNNYNMMDYENAEVFLLFSDKSKESDHPNPYYKVITEQDGHMMWHDIKCGLTGGVVKGEIRLPGFLKDKFGLLNENITMVGQNGSLSPNDSIVDRQIRGLASAGVYQDKPFTIYSTQGLVFGGNEVKIDKNKDTVFRESDINNDLNFEFGTNGRSPFSNDSSRGQDSITIIGENAYLVLDEENFAEVLRCYFRNFFRATQIRFSLLNLLQGSGKNIYPFLEYYIDFGEGNFVPDKYFTINAEGEYKDFKVNMIIKKPTVKESVLGSFTSIF